jgi:hypothetical protein
MHTVVGTLQVTKGSIEQYARVTNFIHAISTEWNRMRMELDLGNGLDCRIVHAGKSRPIIRTKPTKGKRNEI